MDRSTLSRIYPVLFRALLYAGLGLALVYGLGRIRDQAFAMERFMVRPYASQTASRPEWLRHTVVDDVRREIARCRPRSVFDSQLQVDLRRAVVGQPWVESVVKVERVFPDRAVLRLRMRKPVAVVEEARGSAYALIDAQGVVLERDVQDLATWRQGLPRLPEVRGLRVGIPSIGRRLSQGAACEGARIAGDLATLEGSDIGAHVNIEMIDVSDVRWTGEILSGAARLVTDAGVEIIWGRSSRSPAYREPSLEGKLEGLRKVLRRFPALDGLRLVDLRMDPPLYRNRTRPEYVSG